MNTYGSNDAPRTMFEGDWSCSQCGAKITKLPFEPREDRQNTLKCLDCFKSDGGGRRGAGQSSGERQMFEGSWSCSDCGKEITKLLFNPKPGSGIRCIDCFRASR